MQTAYDEAAIVDDMVTKTAVASVPEFDKDPLKVPAGGLVFDDAHVHAVLLVEHGSNRTFRTLCTESPSPDTVTTGEACDELRKVGEKEFAVGTKRNVCAVPTWT